VSVPKQRNTKEENETIKAGKTPEGWEQQPAKNAQKDKDARWTKKNDASFFGYKNQLGVDKAHKLIRKLDDVLDLSNTGKEVCYRSVKIEASVTTFAGWFSSSGWRLCRPECAHGWSPCGILQRSAWLPARHQNGPRSGAHLGTSPALVRSAKAESPKPAIVRGAFILVAATVCLSAARFSTSPKKSDERFAVPRPGGRVDVEARTGLRMMTTSPRRSLSFRMAGFPR
jgi:hypothetical protein